DLYNPDKKKVRPNFLFTGNYTWIQNVEAAELLARKVFPEILKSIPDAHCYIVGQHAKEKIGELGGHHIHIVDIASSDVKSIHTMFKKNSVFISTLEGPGGTRLKILGAMASGLPVISSPTSIGGLNVQDGKHVLVARTPDEFASQAKLLFEKPNFYEKIRKNARELIEKNYEWSQIASSLESIYKTLISSKKKV
ncbi:MAG: glycosyltransferase family 4 protein, partial [Candidatus Roizmanbacteria bacterium]